MFTVLGNDISKLRSSFCNDSMRVTRQLRLLEM